MLKKSVIIFVSSMMIISCSHNNHKRYHTPKESQKLAEIIAIHNVAIDFDKGTPIVLNAATGGEVSPCGKIDFNQVGSSSALKSQVNDQPYNKNSKTDGCQLKFSNLSIALQNAINSTKRSFKETVIVNGKLTDATFNVIVIANYSGSYCNTTFASGDQLDSCITLQNLCNDYLNKYPDIVDNPIFQKHCAKFY